MIRVILPLLLLINTFSALKAQDTSNTSLTGNPVEYVDELPQYPGGHEAFEKYIKDNLKYPDAAIKNNIQGNVYLSVVISETGKVTNVTVVKDIGGGCGQEASRLIANTTWIPATHDGKPTSVKIHIPIKFKLPDPKQESK